MRKSDEDFMTSRRESMIYAIGAGVVCLAFSLVATWIGLTMLDGFMKPEASDWVMLSAMSLLAVGAAWVCVGFIENAKKCPKGS